MRRVFLLSLLLVALSLLIPWLAVTLTPAGEEASPPAPSVPVSDNVAPDGATPITALCGDALIETTMADWLPGVVAAEMPASFAPEALRAQAVAARTYILRRVRGGGANHPEAGICDRYTCCCAHKNDAALRAQWGKDYAHNMTRIRQAVADTDGVKEQQYLFLAASDTEREKLKSEDIKAPNMSNLQGYFLFRNYGNPLRNTDGVLIASKDGSFCRELSSDELDKLGKCIWSDISKKKYTDILRGSEKEVAYIYLNDNATYYGGRYEENVKGRSVLTAITGDMTETLRFIKEHGMADALGQKREVKSVNIYDCRRIISKAKEINKNGSYGGTAINPIFIMSTMFNTKEIKLVTKAFGDMDDCFIKSVTNQKQSDELFALAQGQCYTSLGGYIAQITFTDGYNQTMYISESDAPGYIK